MKNNRSSYISTRRDAWVEVNLSKVEHNISELKKFIPDNKKILAVIKADAYGHGALMLTPTFIAKGISMLGVASLDEARQLREEGFNRPILVLGAAPIWAYDWVAENNITISIFSDQHLEAAKQTYEKTGIKINAHVKINTSMNRIGINLNEATDYIKKVQNSDFIQLTGIFTHFACAENKEITLKQIKEFKNIVSNFKSENILIHCANTATTIAYQDELNFTNMVREGIGLYGLMPDLPENTTDIPNLKQIIGLKSRIVNIHETQANEGVSYAYTYKTPTNIKIATIPVGYADGVPRLLSNKLIGKINGQKIKQIGNITMDQMMFDITGINANEGDIITLLDEDLSIDDWAKELNTINYELTCRLKVRLPRVYAR